MAYYPNNPNGAATAANSAPVVVTTDQVQDAFVTGASGQTASGNNLLLTSAGTAAIDTMAYSTGAPSYRSIYIQVIATGTISGALIFEGSNDNTNFVSQIMCSESNQSFAATPAISATSYYSAKIAFRYIRLRISTAITGGGSVQAIYRMSPCDYVPKYQPVTAGGTVNVISFPTSTTGYSLTSTASTNAASVKASAGNLYEITVSNTSASAAYVKFYNKAGSPTVGTDTPVLTIPVTATTTISEQFGALGKRFSTGIAIALTGALEASDTSNGPAGVQVSASYL